MKQITNWRNATVADIEADELLDKATKIHVLSYKLVGGGQGSFPDYDRIRKFFQHHIDNKIPVVMHNGKGYDVPLVEKLLGMDLSNLMLIDSLPISWYLNTERNQHGLDSFFPDYGIAKPKIDDWTNLTYDEYRHRCEMDVEINSALWEDFKGRLDQIYSLVKVSIDMGLCDGERLDDEVCFIDQYKETSSVDDYVDRILSFLMFKADCGRLKEATKWKVNVNKLDALIEKLTGLVEAAQMELEGIMPEVPKYDTKTRPKVYYKKNGDLSVHGVAWEQLLKKKGTKDSRGNIEVQSLDVDTLKILKSYEAPNINSHQQIKDFLFLKGWKPRSFKFVKDDEAQQRWADSGFKPSLKPKPRAIPQVSVDGDDGKELCDSVLELAESVPEIMAYAKYTTIKHRLDMCKGFKRDLREGGFLCARVGGYTNTLREQHRELVNLPSCTKPYGPDIRGLLEAYSADHVLIGSDLSGLEDRVKHHFMLPHDRAYVETMLEDDYDAHLLTALSAGMISQKDFDNYKAGIKEPHVVSARKAGKATNYASVYGSGAETLSRTCGLPVSTCKTLIEGYWKLNWSVKAIAEAQCVIEACGGKWLVNPINGFAYSLRSDKDRFSTLCQGTGSYFFDIWCDNILEAMQAKWGKKTLTFTAHDENVFCVRNRESAISGVTELIRESLAKINKDYYLRRELGCDVQIGKNYAEIH